MQTIETSDDIARAVAYLCDREPRFAGIVEVCGLPDLRRGKNGLAGLLDIITNQQISIHAAAAIWRRVEERFAPFDADVMAACPDDDFAACGLSRPKIRTIRAVLEAQRSGHLDFEQLCHLPDDEVTGIMTAISGIGPWSAQIYLLSGLGRADTWPKGDLALQEAARLLFNMKKRPGLARMEKIARKWRPFRAVAARLLWSHYRHVKFPGGSS